MHLSCVVTASVLLAGCDVAIATASSSSCSRNVVSSDSYYTSRPPSRQVLTGHINPNQVFSFVYVPFYVDPGVTSIYVLQNYSNKGAGNSLDLGVFDQRGTALADAVNGSFGTRGWSGGFRNNFTITPSGATPGYNPGPISPGTWNVVLGPYTSTAQGIDWTLDIELGYEPVSSYFSPHYAQTNLDPFPNPDAGKQDAKWLRGDFHMHTVYSDGRYLPNEQIANALARDLDFIFFSDHNTDTSNEIIGAYAPPELLVGRAIEVTTRHGHWQAIGLDRGQVIEWRYHPGDSPGYVAATEQVRRAGGIVSINHPFQNCSKCDWTFGDWDHNEAIEVWNGRFDPLDQVAVVKWQELLVQGKRVTAIGGSDAHSPPDINGLPTTVVRTMSKSQAGIVDGVRRGHAYLVEGPGMELSLTLDGVTAGGNCGGQATMGDSVSRDSLPQNAAVTFIAKGLDGSRACFMSEKGYVDNQTIVAGKSNTHPAAGTNFIRVEVRNSSDVLVGLTNPIFFE